MAQLFSADLPPELDFPSEFPYEVVDTSDDDDSDYLDYDLFFPALSRRRMTHSSFFDGVPTRRLAKYSSYRCDGIPVVKKLSMPPKSTLGGTNDWSAPSGVLRLPHPSLVPFRSSDAAAALQLERLKVAPEKAHFGTCRPDESSPFRHLPEQHQLPSSMNRDPFSHRMAREVEFVKQRHDAVLLSQQRQLQIQAQIRAKKLGFAESSKALMLRNRSWSVRGCAGTGVFLPRGYGDVAPESCKISGGPPPPRVVVPAKVVRALNKTNAQLQGLDELLLERRNALWMRHHHQFLTRLPES